MNAMASSLSPRLQKVKSYVTIQSHLCINLFSLCMTWLCEIQVEDMNSLVSELADVAARERAMLNECESLFGSIAALQVRRFFLMNWMQS